MFDVAAIGSSGLFARGRGVVAAPARELAVCTAARLSLFFAARTVGDGALFVARASLFLSMFDAAAIGWRRFFAGGGRVAAAPARKLAVVAALCLSLFFARLAEGDRVVFIANSGAGLAVLQAPSTIAWLGRTAIRLKKALIRRWRPPVVSRCVAFTRIRVSTVIGRIAADADIWLLLARKLCAVTGPPKAATRCTTVQSKAIAS
jgi:hypothetical protein